MRRCAWCTWESATLAWPPTAHLDARYEDPDFALAFARLVTHYVGHDVFLEDGVLLRDAHLLADIPGVLVQGRSISKPRSATRGRSPAPGRPPS